MAIRLCIHGRVYLAEQFLGKSLWLVGGRPTPWTNEDNPPVPTATETSVEDPQFAKLITLSYTVYEVDETNYDLKLDQRYWQVAVGEDRYTNEARYLYLKFILERQTGPNVDVRQLGVVDGVVPLPGHENNNFLLDSEVSNYGKLIYLEHRRLVDRNPIDQGELFEYLLAF